MQGWKTQDWKTRDLKSMESLTKRKCRNNVERESKATAQKHSTGIRSSGAEIKTVSGGMVAVLKSSVHQGRSAPPSCA